MAYELGQPRCWFRVKLAMPRSILHVGTWCLARCWQCTKQQTWDLPFSFSSFVREIWSIQRSGKITKAAMPFLKKKRKKRRVLRFLHIHTCGSNMRLKFQIETRKIERGIAVIPHLLVLITTCLKYRNRFSATSRDASRIGQCNWYLSSPCVLKPSTPYIYHLDRERWFLEPSYTFVGQTCGEKW